MYATNAGGQLGGRRYGKRDDGDILFSSTPGGPDGCIGMSRPIYSARRPAAVGDRSLELHAGRSGGRVIALERGNVRKGCDVRRLT